MSQSFFRWTNNYLFKQRIPKKTALLKKIKTIQRTICSNQPSCLRKSVFAIHNQDKEMADVKIERQNLNITSSVNKEHNENECELSVVTKKCEAVISQMTQIIIEQRNIQNHIVELKDSTVLLGQMIRKVNIYKAAEKLIRLWKIMKIAPDDFSKYYSEILYESLLELGLEAIIPCPGDKYDPIFHQKEDPDSDSRIVIICDEYNWGWKIGDIVLSKAIVKTT